MTTINQKYRAAGISISSRVGRLLFHVCICCAFIYSVFAANAFGNTRIAVYGLRSIGISQELAESLQEQVESSLSGCSGYDVLSRSDLSLILKENVLRQYGVCEDDTCLLRTAALLGVDKILTGTISKIGNTYNIVLKTIDVKTGRIEGSTNERFTGSVDQLFAATEKALYRLFIKKAPEIVVQTITDTVTVVRVDTVSLHTEHPLSVPPETVRSAAGTPVKTGSGKRFGLGAAAILSGLAVAILLNTIL